MESSSHSHQRPSYYHDFYGSEYIGSIRALSAYYDDDEHEQKRQQYTDDSHGRSVPSSPLPFAIDDDEIVPNRSQCESLSSDAFLDGNSLSFRERDISTSPPHGDDDEDQEEGGIVILSSPDDDDGDDEEDMWESHGLPLETEQTTLQTRQLQPQPETMEEPPLDSIIMAAAAHVERLQNTRTTNMATMRRQDGSLLDLEAWMEQVEGALVVEEDSSHRCNDADDAAAPTTNSFWDRFHNKTNHAASSSPPSSHPSPIRATQLRHNQFIVQLDIVPPPDDCRTTQEWQQYVMEVMANVQWLHLWFDPIPIVLETTILDGSGSYSPPNSSSLVTTSPSLSVSGPLPDRGGEYERPSSTIPQQPQQRRRDGEWIEISTPPLKPPHDSHLSTCFRRVRVGIRSSLGFPQRIRSMLLIERNAGRMGMTIGYGRGTVVHHEWSVRREGERIVVLDEVRLHRSDEEDGGGGGGGGRRYYLYCCFCVVMRFVWRLVEWMFVRWYQPDLASYMAQTISSLEKLRILIEGGVVQESAMMEGENWDGGNHADLISAPLLG